MAASTKVLIDPHGAPCSPAGMCNLYSLTKGQAAILALTKATQDRTGNLPQMPGIFPDAPAPIVRTIDGERELTLARWGMPSPQLTLNGRTTDPGVTNVRNTKSPHWRRWLGPAHRCLVPFTSFSKYDTVDGKKVPVWFAADEDRPLMAFAGIWTEWTSTRKKAEGEITTDAYGFLTTEANGVVGPIHPKAMPFIGARRQIGTWDVDVAIEIRLRIDGAEGQRVKFFPEHSQNVLLPICYPTR